ncbi:MAG: DUF3524 domain-containing protein [Deltaproteobacteria bacterium]|nr:DUF3524 domain-containing protein [Deltaproteobacteria bacterium]
MKFLFLEPFFGGSHRSFAEGLIAHSRYEIELLTLPARFWKWRMRGAALYFIRKISNLGAYDGLIATDLMSLSDFKALSGSSCPPTLVYFHENQMTYPLAPGESMDFQFGFTDMTTALAADQVLFNSQFHHDAFFSRLPDFLDMMPEYRPKWVIDILREKSGFLYPGCQFPAQMALLPVPDSMPPLIIWNHRWEFDKNPSTFFDALDRVDEQGLDFRMALMGENFQAVPEDFIAARNRYQHRIVQYGYVESRKKYLEWLMEGSIVVSTATQENFGISVIEAMRSGCIPLLPHRLVYPEILPKDFHADFLYKNPGELVEKLSFILSNLRLFETKRHKLSTAMGSYAWENRIAEFDEALEQLVRGSGSMFV